MYATGLFQRGRTISALLSAVLLAACGTSPSLPDGQAGAPHAVDKHAAAPQHKSRRVLARDILTEWGTFGLDRVPRRKTRSARPRDEGLLQPYQSIREIMANEACRACEQKPYHGIVLQAANEHGVPPALIHAVIQKESGYNPGATSPRKARGLMQLMPGTGKLMGVENSAALYDPHTNINAGTAYLKLLMQNHDTVEEVLAAYNAGPGNVRRYNGVPPFSETRRYVRDVIRYFASSTDGD